MSKSTLHYRPEAGHWLVFDGERHIGFVETGEWFEGDRVYRPVLLNGEALTAPSTSLEAAALRLQDFYDYKGGEV